MAVLGVNWDDTQTQDLTLDLVALQIASNTYDNCETIDLRSKERSINRHNAGPQTFKDIKPHDHIAVKIKCLPF